MLGTDLNSFWDGWGLPPGDPQLRSMNASYHKEQYSRILLFRLRLSQITAYLEVKIWSLLQHGILTKGNKILWNREETVPKEQFFLFSTIFSIYL